MASQFHISSNLLCFTFMTFITHCWPGWWHPSHGCIKVQVDASQCTVNPSIDDTAGSKGDWSLWLGYRYTHVVICRVNSTRSAGTGKKLV
ncbi:hypothetical protein B0T13DRAFT_175236 [Neurospora crassa]|nr:hypothetical protein B0T13DRAFT_175236 [Neurospora crassa]